MAHKHKIKSWLIKLVSPEVYRGLRQKFKNRQSWSFNHTAIARGLAAGLLFTFIPLPVQIIPAVMLAIVINGNILVAAAAAFISNPLTFIPINYFILKVGGYVTGREVVLPPMESINLTISNWSDYMNQLKPWFNKMAEQFLIGLFLVSIISAAVGYILVNIIWLCFNKFKVFRKKKR